MTALRGVTSDFLATRRCNTDSRLRWSAVVHSLCAITQNNNDEGVYINSSYKNITRHFNKNVVFNSVVSLPVVRTSWHYVPPAMSRDVVVWQGWLKSDTCNSGLSEFWNFLVFMFQELSFLHYSLYNRIFSVLKLVPVWPQEIRSCSLQFPFSVWLGLKNNGR